MHIPGKWAWYPLYLLCVTGLFLYILFPAETVRRHLASNASRVLAPYRIEIGTVKPTFPPGVRLRKIAVLHNDRQLLQLASLRITPDYGALLDPGHTFKAQAAAWDGYLQSRLRIMTDQDALTVSATTLLTDVALETIPELRSLSPREISGRLAGEVLWNTSRPGDPVRANLSVSAARIALLVPFLSLRGIDFTSIDTSITLNRQRVLVKRCVFAGRQFSGELSGNIQLRNPVGESLLALAGAIKVQPDFVKELQSTLPQGLLPEENTPGGYRLRFGGTLDKPTFSLK